MNVPDPVCNGKGWLWEDPNKNRLTCWRCAGTGEIIEVKVNKEKGPISPEAEGDTGETSWTPKSEEP